MFNRKSLFLFLAVSMLAIGVSVEAQGAAQAGATTVAQVPEGGVPRYIRSETQEQRMARIGTAEDPGMNPDPEEIFWRFGKPFTIDKFEKEFAKYLPEPGWVRPMANVNIPAEIYQENDRFIWAWIPVFDRESEDVDANAGRPVEEPKYDDALVNYYRELRKEFTPIDVPQSDVRVGFEEASAGLATTGSWRNGAAVADMNRDGMLDLIFPPQRGAAGSPAIFLGSKTGEWQRWDMKWPRSFDYGTVVAADFNKDKHVDLAFSIHLKGVAVFLGDSRGNFREVSNGVNEYYPTRRLVAADVDADGWMDLVAISEGPVGRQHKDMDRTRGGLRAYLNRKKGQSFEPMNIADRREYLGGDYLSSGYFNGDRRPDFVGASVYFNSTHVLFLSKATEYDSASEGLLIPGRSYYHANAAGRFVKGAKTDDFVVSFVRHWAQKLPENVVAAPPIDKVTGIDRLTFLNGKTTRVPVVRWRGARRIDGMATGDVSGDGHTDIVYTDAVSQELKLLLGDGSGGFQRGTILGAKLEPQRTYDLILQDLNGDRRPDILLTYEASSTTATADSDGSIHVFLNRGVRSK